MSPVERHRTSVLQSQPAYINVAAELADLGHERYVLVAEHLGLDLVGGVGILVESSPQESGSGVVFRPG